MWRREALCVPGLAIILSLLLASVIPLTPRAVAASSRMTGRVLDAGTQAPIAGAAVELLNASGGQGFFRAHTGKNGEFTLNGIAADRYYNLTVSADGYADFMLSNWQFPSAQRSVEVMVPLDRAGVLEVRATAADGKTPVPDARVTVRSERAEQWWEGNRAQPHAIYAGKDGVTRFDGLAAGYWTVQVEASGLLTSENRRVPVRRGEVTPVPVRMVKPASLSGVVRLADSTGVGGLSVIARGAAEATATTGPAGEFTLADLGPGRYRVEVSHEGFQPTATKEGWTLREGESRAGLELTVTPRPAELAFVLQREAFALVEPVKIGLRSFRLGVVDLTLWQIPAARLLDPQSDFRTLVSSADTLGLALVSVWQHRTRDGPPYAWREEELKVPGDLGAGAYLLRGRAGGIERRTLFFVTDLSMLLKRSPSQLLVSLASLKTALPVKGAAFFVLPAGRARGRAERGNDWIESLRAARERRGITDDEGLALVALGDSPREALVVAVSDKNGIAVAETRVADAADRHGDQAFLYTDRPIYRPGQTVDWKLFARRAAGDGYALPDASSATLSLTGPGGASVEVPKATLSPHGSADGAIALPSDLVLGEWSLSASAGRARSQASFSVQEYRKPEFRVDVDPDREVYVNGDEMRFKVAASYFFGAPVFGAAVRYNLFESRIRRDDEWSNGEGEEDAGETPVGYGRVLKTGETRTDVDGRVVLTFTPERVSYDRRLTLEVEVVDASSRAVSGRGSAIVGRGLFTVQVRPVARLVHVGDPVGAEVITLDHGGKPVSAAVTVELDQEAWNPLERRYTHSTRPLASTTVTTDKTGRARVSLSPAPARSGNLTVRARAEDAKGNRIEDESSFWIYDPRVWDYAYRYPTLEAFADKARYQAGDSAHILVNTDQANAAVLATVEGRTIADYKLVHLFGNTGMVSFVIRPDYAPNVYVAVHVRSGKEVHSQVLELPVESRRHDLAIELHPDRDEYRPGDMAKIEVATHDHFGAPVRAELSIGVVDEAIYSLKPDATPDPHEVFYGQRPNWVTTATAFPVLYYGGADKGGRPEVRKDFRDVAFWAPAVATDSSGHGSISFKWPDNLTTWRLTSRGATESTLVGKSVVKTRVSKPVVARLAGPRSFVAGDQATLVSLVNSRSTATFSGLEQSLAASGAAKLTGPATQRGDLAASGELRTEWHVEIPDELAKSAIETPEAAFEFRAHSQTDSDALELRVPVRPHAVAEHPYGAGVLEGASTSEAVLLPADLVRSGSELELELSPSPAAMAMAALDYLTAYPWGCTEQTANAILPATALLAAAKQAGVTLPGFGDPARRLGPTLAHLRALQSPEGGWGWWEGNDPDPYLTALALDALARSETAGLGGAGDALMPGWTRLLRMMSEVRSTDGEAYVLAHLTPLLALENSAQRMPDLKSRLEDLALSVYSSRDRLGIAGLALAARAQQALGRSDQAKTLLVALMARSVADGNGLHFPSDPESEDAWYGEEIQNAGEALSAIAAIAPADPRGAQIIHWLAARRRGPYWRSTRSTAPAALGLADWLAAHPGEVRPEYKLRVEWNGESLLERAVTAADAFGARALSVRIPGAKLKPGANRLVLAKQGAGTLSWSWEARALVPSPGPDTAKEKRLAVTREFLRAERTSDRRGRPRFLATPLAAGESFKVGEQVLVRLTLRAPRALSWLMVEDPRLAGFEIDGLLPEGAEWPWGTHAEEHDASVTFFLDHLDQGDTVLEYLARPEIAGSFAALPAAAGSMYDPDLKVRSGEARLTVAPR